MTNFLNRQQSISLQAGNMMANRNGIDPHSFCKFGNRGAGMVP
jgi:hypothetical protein